MLRINVQLAEKAHSVKWTRYLLSDIAPKLRQFQPFLAFRRPTPPQVLPERPANFNPLQWLLDPDKGKSQVDRILAELVRAEAHEQDVWLKDDYRQAFVIVSLAERGNPIPFITSSYICYGLHPDKVWPSLVARRKADCGKLYPVLFDQNDIRKPGPTEAELSMWAKDRKVTPEDERPEQFETPDASLSNPSPKKPVQSETRSRRKNVA